MEQEIEKLSKILSSLTATSLERKQSIDELKCLILKLYNENKHYSLFDTSNGASIIQSLLGILRCSREPSLLISTCQFLSTLIHFANNDVKQELNRLKVINILLPLLDPPTPVTYERVWEWVPVQERVLATLRKVMFCSEVNQSSFIKYSGTAKIIKMCQKREKINYSPQTTQRLQELVVNKLLIGAVTPIPKKDKDKMASQFPILSSLKTVNYPMYHVDLADENKAWLTDTLIKEGLGLPDSHSLVSKEGVAWIIVKGTHVTGPTAIWLQYSVDKKSPAVTEMYQSLQKLEYPCPPLSQPLSLGSVYAVYVQDKRETGEEGERREEIQGERGEGIQGGSWHRGWLLKLPSQPDSSPTFFCMDYGFSVTIATPGHVTELPQECRGIPPQAVPCILGGLGPPPKSYIILRHVTAILCNMAYAKEVNRREISAVSGVQLLLELITSLDPGVNCNALEALNNLAQSKEVCQSLRQLGAIQTLTELCISSLTNNDTKISRLCLGVLKNLLIRDPVQCIEIFNVFNVAERLSEWREKQVEKEKEKYEELREQLHHVLTAIDSIQKGNMPVITTNDPPLTCAPFPKSPRPSTADTNITESLSSETKSINNKTTPKNETTPPVYRVLSQSTRSDDSTHLPCPVLSPKVNFDKFYNKGEKMCFEEKEERQSPVHFIDIRNVNVLMNSVKGVLLKSMCALGNEENGGSIYIGVEESGIIQGMKMNRGEKDLFCVVFDGVTKSYLQPPFDNKYNICFHPVTEEGVVNSASDSTHCIIQINVLSSPTNTVHLIVFKSSSSSEGGGGVNESCYVSRNGRSVKLSFLEVQKLVKEREIKKYQKLLNKQ